MKRFIIAICCVVVLLGSIIGAFYLFHPLKYKKEIFSAAELSGLPPDLIYGVVYAESGFRSEVVSNKGAVGLMQVLPSTAEYVCKLNNLEIAPSLTDVSTNLNIGSLYLKYLIKKFDGNIYHAIVAYNAGEGKVREWIRSGDFNGSAYKISLNYADKVLKKQKIYQKLLK